jgi:putative hydrolase of the HAD superfamily
VRLPVQPCVVFDLGGVLLRPEGPAADLARVLGVEVPAVLAPYWRHRDAYDRGGPAAEFWGALRQDLVTDGLEPAAVTDDELDHLDASRWAQLADGSAGCSTTSHAPARRPRCSRTPLRPWPAP